MLRERFGLWGLIDLPARLWLAMVFVLLPALGYIVVTSLLARDQARAQAETDLLFHTRLAGQAEQQSLNELASTLALAALLAPVRDAAQTASPAPCQASLVQLA